MPPFRSGRASKACDLCRKYKTRCYASSGDANRSCLRCNTLSQICSLEREAVTTCRPSVEHSVEHVHRSAANVIVDGFTPECSVDDRLERLERTVASLADRLDTKLDALASSTNNGSPAKKAAEPIGSTEQNPAPVLLIRDAARDAGLNSPNRSDSNESLHSDVISTGLVTLSTAHTLVELFHVHYGRWVKFQEDIPTETLLVQTRKTPALICSILLIGVRHTTQDLADRLAPPLFKEAERLITSSLLTVPQSIQFFQTVLILSLWSTTIGQVPLSVDSWLLTGYALQQALISPHFTEVFQSSQLPTARCHLDAWCLWNHLCLAHLQYCVGTRRQAMVTEVQINRCSRLIESESITNYESRMVAEVKLYWIIYKQCSGSQIDLPETKGILQSWRHKWHALFDQSRSQFLQMGFHFAHLMVYSNCLKSSQTAITNNTVGEMIRHSTAIINLAIDTTDDRTRHLTDHIYHIVTFSALTLSRLIHAYEAYLRVDHDIESLDALIVKLIHWLRSIGLPCHTAYMLGGIVSAQFAKLRPNSKAGFRDDVDVNGVFHSPSVPEIHSVPFDAALLYPDFIGSELFNLDTGLWPQWEPIYQDDEASA